MTFIVSFTQEKNFEFPWERGGTDVLLVVVLVLWEALAVNVPRNCVSSLSASKFVLP